MKDGVARRRLLTVIAAAGTAPCLFLAAVQQPSAQPTTEPRPKPWRIGYLSTAPAQSAKDPATTAGMFLRSLLDAGLVESKDFVIEWRFAEGNRDRLKELAADLQRRSVDVIFAVSSFSVDAARGGVPDVPIVFINAGNPVGSGFVASLARPGGRITGVSNVSILVSGKYLELLHEAVPKLASVGILFDPTHPNHPVILQQVEKTGRSLGVKVARYELPTAARYGDALTNALSQRVGALIVPPHPQFNAYERAIAEFALKNRLPVLFGGHPSGLEIGGLLGFDGDPREIVQRGAALVQKIMKGARPADLPVELPTRYITTINLRVAKALGIAVPQTLLLRADNVIE